MTLRQGRAMRRYASISSVVTRFREGGYASRNASRIRQWKW